MTGPGPVTERAVASQSEVIMRDERSRCHDGESGFALILAILSLMLLTFLGLTLAATTSTELQIATNYRWSQQALYNAEAGLEVAKAYLKVIDPATLVPFERATWTQLPGSNPTPFPQLPGTRTLRNDAWGNPPRNFAPSEDPVDPAKNCDHFGDGAGYGIVFDDGVTPGLPLQNVTQITLPGGVVVGDTLRGAFTVWVRRRLTYPSDTTIQDDPDANTLIVTAEGVAPANGMNLAPAGNQRFYANRAVRVLEATMRVGPPTGNTCNDTLPQNSTTGFLCLP
jgi:hypothetical protein